MVEAGEAHRHAAPRVHEEMPDNLALRIRIRRPGRPPSRAFANAAHVVRVERHRAAHRRQSDGAEVLPRALRRGEDSSTLYSRPRASRTSRRRWRRSPASAPEKFRVRSSRCRRRLRRAQRNLSGVPGRDAGREADRPARCDGPARARKRSPATITRARADLNGELALDEKGQVPGAARRMAGQPRRLLLGRRRADQHRRGADQFGHQPLQHAARSTAGTGWCSPTRRRHRLSRRRPSERLLSVGAPGRGGGARRSASIRSGCAAATFCQGRVPDEDADRLDLRQRRSGAPARYRAAGGGLGRLQGAPQGGEEERASFAASGSRCSSSRPAAVGKEQIEIRIEPDGQLAMFSNAGPIGAGARDGISGGRCQRPRHARGPDRASLQRRDDAQARSAPAASVRAR